MTQPATSLIQMPETGIEVIPLEELEKLDQVVDQYSRKREFLIPALKEAQDMFGYLPHEVQLRLAEGFRVSPSHVYGVVTFYSFFTTTPRGRNTIRLCLGTACYVKGSRKILGNVVQELHINVGETSPDLRFTLEAVRCLGACGLAPVMVVDNNIHGNVSPSEAIDKLQRYE